MLLDCYLLDVGFQGYPHTLKRGDLEQSLDRVVINMQWRMLFQDAIIFHLSQFKYDHRLPLLKIIGGTFRGSKAIPFCFMALWITHANFHRFVRAN